MYTIYTHKHTNVVSKLTPMEADILQFKGTMCIICPFEV